MLVYEPLVLPNLKPGCEMREHVEAMGSSDSALIIVMFKVMRRTDIPAVIEEVNHV